MTTDSRDCGGLGRRARLPLLAEGRKSLLAKWRLGNLLWFPFLQDCCQEDMMESQWYAEGEQACWDEQSTTALFCVYLPEF